MNKLDIIGMGIRNLWRRKLRTFLTVLGVVIGTSAIVVMISLSIGIEVATRKQAESYGSLNNIEIWPGQNEQGEVHLTEEIYEKLKNLDGVEAATPIIETPVTLQCGKFQLTDRVVGVDPSALGVLGLELEEGRLLTNEDEMAIIFNKNSLMRFEKPRKSGSSGGRRYYGGFYGKEQQEEQDPPVNVMENKIRLTVGYGNSGDGSSRPKMYKAEAAGILKSDRSSQFSYRNLMNIETVKRLKQEYDRMNDRNSKKDIEFEQVFIRAVDVDSATKLCEEIEAMGLNAHSMSSYLKQMEESTKTIRLILGGIGAISMLVAALMIANTMVMSIYERTKEIGIMKVLGAALGDIGQLFLVESALIGLVGGIFGLGTSYGISYLLNTFLGNGLFGRGMGEGTPISVIPFWLIILAVGFTSIVGLLSGLYPSIKAMRISALEAIKTE